MADTDVSHAHGLVSFIHTNQVRAQAHNVRYNRVRKYTSAAVSLIAVFVSFSNQHHRPEGTCGSRYQECR